MARQKLGQHFLSSPGVLERIAVGACPPGQSLVIEIGPGKGALTRHLLARAKRVVAIEIDPAMVEHLRRAFPGEPRLEIVEADALQVDFTRWGPAAITGNLPYYVATPILERVAASGGVFLIQKEVAERVTARPGSKAYGYFSVLIALLAESEMLFTVKPGAFRPPPKVDSAVIRLRPQRRAAELGIDDPRKFLEFVSACFRQKRKTLRNNLTGMNLQQSIEEMPEAGKRAEQLTLEQFADLYRRVYHNPRR
jgi:16S rRNA (adenine1518-N6/adenine1519-N6)-dimethyltransferase